ncbi:hypothetical protein FNJ87_19090 [Nonlabens mediterrranea]|uniref:Uncharacterized protein n=1 Tax=Nonlabens mediterrranea TaxID=1419947 RepID=A0ABS0AA99_9FLAO|nr:hypothetical protein [Nonlabens mediterrranea]MBF4986323.1 hypothetical protein [Nonlabens mediterrranea]
MIYFILVAVLLLLFSYKRNREFKRRKKLINGYVEERQLMNYDWDEIDNHYLAQGFNQQQIDAVKTSIQDYSAVAKEALFPEDHIYNDLLISNHGSEQTEILIEIEKRLNLDSIDDELFSSYEPILDSYFKVLRIVLN